MSKYFSKTLSVSWDTIEKGGKDDSWINIICVHVSADDGGACGCDGQGLNTQYGTKLRAHSKIKP